MTVQTNQSQRTEIKVEKSKVTVDHVQEHRFNNQFDQAQVRQEVTKTYPQSQPGNEHQDLIFGMDEYNIQQGQSYPEKRVTWLDVPKGSTTAQVQSKLDNQYPNSVLFRILDSNPVLREGHHRMSERQEDPDAFLLNVAKNQMVKNSDGNPIDRVGQIISIDWDNITSYKQLPEECQYRYIGFSVKPVEDEDRRKTLAEIRKDSPERASTGDYIKQASEVPFEKNQ